MTPTRDNPAAFHSSAAEALGREGMVTVWTNEGLYAGCMGIETWSELLPDKGDGMMAKSVEVFVSTFSNLSNLVYDFAAKKLLPEDLASNDPDLRADVEMFLSSSVSGFTDGVIAERNREEVPPDQPDSSVFVPEEKP